MTWLAVLTLRVSTRLGFGVSYRGGGQQEEGAQTVDSIHARGLERAIEALHDGVHGEWWIVLENGEEPCHGQITRCRSQLKVEKT